MNRVVLSAIFLAALIGCASPEDFRDPELCLQTQEGNSNLNLIFVFDDLKENTRDHYSNQTLSYISSVEPFSTIDPNVYEIPAQATLCWNAQNNNVARSQLDCDWEELNRRITACALPNFKMLIITGEDVQTVAVPTYYEPSFTVINERDFSRYTLLHEFGHLFGLQEEVTRLRVKASSPAWQARKPNCAPDRATAAQWWGDMVGQNDTGYYEGCAGSEEKIRPNNETVMGHGFEWSDYGYVSTKYLEGVLDCCYRDNRTAYSCGAFFAEFPEWAACRK